MKTIHIWTGIVSGLFLSVVALTGSLIVFRAEFERATLPRSASTAAAQGHVTMEEAAQTIAMFRPDSHIRRVRSPAGPDGSYIFQVESSGKRTERIVSDASTGRVLGTLQPGWVDWMVDLHRNFLSGGNGRKFVGIVGIVRLALSATGLLLWLIGPRNWRSWVSIRRGSVMRFNYQLHRASGLWAYAFLAVVSFTGIERAFPDTMRQAVHAVTGGPVTVPAPKKIPAASRLPLDDYLRIGRAAMPDGVPSNCGFRRPATALPICASIEPGISLPAGITFT